MLQFFVEMSTIQRRRLWLDRSMEGAVKSVKEGKGLREASRSYGVPVETLRRQVLGAVEIDCRPGPPTIFTKEEEDTLGEYLITMADMGYGLTREMVMRIAYVLAEKLQNKHSFKGEMAGRYWFEGFRKRHACIGLDNKSNFPYTAPSFPKKSDIISILEQRALQ